MELKEIMTAFAAEIGLTDLAPDEDGVYHLSIDDMTVSFAEDEGRLLTWAEVCEPPPEGQDRLNRVLLEAMFMGRATGGAVFSIDHESGKVFLHRHDSLAGMELDGFRVMLEGFVNTLESWTHTITDFRAVAPEIAEAQRSSAEEARLMGLGGFMQV